MKLKQFGQIAKDLDIKASRLAYAWIFSNLDVSSAITSTRKPDRIDENIVAVDVILSSEAIDQIDELRSSIGANIFLSLWGKNS